jgi:hypothetical protein
LTATSASSAPAAPRLCPSTALLELTSGVRAPSKARWMAALSSLSFIAVPVPCALM